MQIKKHDGDVTNLNAGLCPEEGDGAPELDEGADARALANDLLRLDEVAAIALIVNPTHVVSSAYRRQTKIRSSPGWH